MVKHTIEVGMRMGYLNHRSSVGRESLAEIPSECTNTVLLKEGVYLGYNSEQNKTYPLLGYFLVEKSAMQCNKQSFMHNTAKTTIDIMQADKRPHIIPAIKIKNATHAYMQE